MTYVEDEAVKSRKAYLKRELNRLDAIPCSAMLPEVVPFVKKYKADIAEEYAQLTGEEKMA